MSRGLRKILVLGATALLGSALLLFCVLGTAIDRSMNKVGGGMPREPSDRARELYDSLFVADLHADSLLWGRDLSKRGEHGHVDLPRLLSGGVALQAFTVVTQVPMGINIESNPADSDMVLWLAFAQRWPPATWTSLAERALLQARRLDELEAGSGGQLAVLRTSADLDGYLSRRGRGEKAVAAFLGIEGAHALDAELANVDRLFDAGFRMMGPTHFFDNAVAGSAHGLAKGGLTGLGRQVIARMQELGMIVDLAHSSPATVDEVLALAVRPVVVSHGGVKGTCDNTRNLSDKHLRGIAATGGVIGIGYWETAVCGDGPADIARAIVHAIKVAGVRHVGLGSDFDGAITAPFDTTGLVALVDELLDEGLSDDDIVAVMGGNTLRVLRAALPAD